MTEMHIDCRPVGSLPAPAPESSVDVLGVRVSALNLTDIVATIEDWRAARRRDYVCCVCVHGIVTANHDAKVKSALNGAGLATKDGMPVSLWCRAVGHVASQRVCGSELMEEMCRRSVDTGSRHYFYGSSARVLEALVSRLQQRYPGLIVAGYRSPPFRALSVEEEEEDIAAINATRPDYVWVGLGMPKQELWMAKFVGKIDATSLFGVGAAFDFHAGIKRRAPPWMQRNGLEWLFRLCSEPRRLARRYVVDNGTFIALVCRHMITRSRRSHSIEPSRAQSPSGSPDTLGRLAE